MPGILCFSIGRVEADIDSRKGENESKVGAVEISLPVQYIGPRRVCPRHDRGRDEI